MIEVRRFPWPYKAMLAICSDLDETPDLASYLTLSRYLNSRDQTVIGRGLGLETGNTIYFDMTPGSLSYWNTSDEGREAMHALMRSGHIDCFHSFGDLASTRAHVGRALDALARHDCQLAVWVDHAIAPSNLGPDIMRGEGDVPGAQAYHADLTLAHGVRYVWLGRVSSCMGQDVPYSLMTGLAQSVDRRSLLNTAKDGIKLLRGAVGDQKYALHWGNRLTRPYTLRDGRAVTEFMRCNPHPYGVSVGDHAAGMGNALNPISMQRLIDREGWCILYTHLGKHLAGQDLLPGPTRQSLETLAEHHHRGEILVTTTRRLLDYHSLIQNVSYCLKGDCLLVNPGGLDPSGLTFHGLQPGQTVLLDGQPQQVQWNPPDHTGRASCSLPLTRMSYPL